MKVQKIEQVQQKLMMVSLQSSQWMMSVSVGSSVALHKGFSSTLMVVRMTDFVSLSSNWWKFFSLGSMSCSTPPLTVPGGCCRSMRVECLVASASG